MARHGNRLWVAFECTVPAVSACVAPLTPDLKSIDLSRLTVPVRGREGPYQNHPLVTLTSASAPTLLSFQNKFYLYWQIDRFDNQLREHVMPTRGVQIEEDPYGQVWAAGSKGRPVLADDAKLTSLVHDVDPHDETKDHVANMTCAAVIDGKIFEIASIGGTAGRQVCRSSHDLSTGCWRISVSVTTAPLGYNVFGAQHVLPAVGLPANTVEYPRVMIDPSGRHFLLGNFSSPKVQPPAEGRVLYPNDPPQHNAEYIPFEPADLIRNH